MSLSEGELGAIRAITVGPSMAYAIVKGAKKVENRSWNTKYRGPLLVHAGSSSRWYDEEDVDQILIETGRGRLPKEITWAAFVGLVTLSDVAADGDRRWKDDPWFRGPFGFVLTRPMRFRNPVEAKGKLGLWRPERKDLREMSSYLQRYIR